MSYIVVNESTQEVSHHYTRESAEMEKMLLGSGFLVEGYGADCDCFDDFDYDESERLAGKVATASAEIGSLLRDIEKGGVSVREINRRISGVKGTLDG